MQLYPHNSEDEDMRCDSFMAQLVWWAKFAGATLLFVAVVLGPLYVALQQ